jgi:hypothetical protein
MNSEPPPPRDPDRLVRLFQQVERGSRRTPDELLRIACQLLHIATTGLVVSRGCTGVTFEFEGNRTHAVVTLIAVTDTKGQFVLALDLLQKWKPDGETRLGDLLERAAEAYLDRHLSQWRENEGADGHLTIDIRQDPDGALVLDPRGHATVRTMAETPTPFPART